MGEHWRDVPGYEGRYQVSTHGRIKSLLDPNEFLFLRPTPSGGRKKYLRVTLRSGGGMKHYVHSLVMAAHGPARPSPRHRIEFLDRDPTNCYLGNLTWNNPTAEKEPGAKA